MQKLRSGLNRLLCEEEKQKLRFFGGAGQMEAGRRDGVRLLTGPAGEGPSWNPSAELSELILL